MAFSLTSFNTSEFRVLRPSVADFSEFIIILTPYLPSSEFSELEIKLTYSSTFEYYFSVSLDGQPVPYDFQSDNIRIQMFTSEEYSSVRIDYPVECYIPTCPESLFLEQTLLPFSSSDNGSGDGSAPVDLTSVIEALSALDTKLSNKIDSLDVQIPDDLNSKLSTLQSNIQNLDLSSLNIGDILLGSSLNGNMCRYKDGDTVRIQGLLGDFTVVWSNFLRFGDQDYTVFYQVSRDVGGGVLKYQFVPEALVFYPTEVI